MTSWRTTDNGLEIKCRRGNDSTLLLDEIVECEPAYLTKLIYMIANGRPKTRYSSTADELEPWRLLYISSGELPTKTYLEKAGHNHHGGQAVRLIDIPIAVGDEYGAFHSPPPNTPTADFSRYLCEMSGYRHGTVAQAFITHIVTNFGADLDFLRSQIAAFTANHPTYDGVESRVLQYFSLSAAAGELAIALNILPWPAGHAIEAASITFGTWRRYRSENALSVEGQVMECLRNALAREGTTAFLPYEGAKSVGNLGKGYGYRREVGANLELILPKDGFERLFSKWPARSVCQILAARSLLRRDGSNFTVKRAIPGYKNARCYVLILRDGI